MTALVLVSHSRPLAQAVRELALQMAQGESVPTVLVAAGTADGGLGTDAAAVADALTRAAGPRADEDVVVFVDLGSAVMSAQMALDFVDPDVAARVTLSAAPLVEGAVPAVVAATLGKSGAQVAAEAERGLAAKHEALAPPDAAPQAAAGNDQPAPGTPGHAGAEASGAPAGGVASATPTGTTSTVAANDQAAPSASAHDGAGVSGAPAGGGASATPTGTDTAAAADSDASAAAADSSAGSSAPAVASGSRPEATATATITDPQGLHARPAAALARALVGLDAQATVARPGAAPVPADSPSLLATLAAPAGTQLTFAAWGPDAERAVRALAAAASQTSSAPAAPRDTAAAPAAQQPPSSPASPAASSSPTANTTPAAAADDADAFRPSLPRLICKPSVDASDYRPSGDPVRERERLEVAIKQAARTVADARERGCNQPGADAAKIGEILDMVDALVRDRALAKGALKRIRAGQDAITAVHAHVRDIADRLERAAKSDYLRQRAQDLLLAAHLVAGALVDRPTAALVDCAQVNEPFVLRVNQLDAVSAALLLPSGIRGIEVSGGMSGHGVMIARALNLPVRLLQDEDAPPAPTTN